MLSTVAESSRNCRKPRSTASAICSTSI